MKAQDFSEACAPSARGWPWASRRVGAVCLLLGWAAFWLTATLQPCCKLSMAAPHPVAGAAVSHNAAFDDHGDAGHHSPDSSDICRNITIAVGDALATAVHSVGGEQPAQAYPASLIQERYVVRRAIYTIEYPPLPPPRTLPFYLRTSRILI